MVRHFSSRYVQVVRVSMPGMMDSILNIGLNDDNVSKLAESFNDERFALDSYRRLIQMYSNVVLGLEHERFEAVIANKKRMDNVTSDADFTVEQLNWIIDAYKNTVERFSEAPFPQRSSGTASWCCRSSLQLVG